MKKTILLLVFILALLLLCATSCGHTHDWIAADCDSAKTCSVCQTTEGEPLGHDWIGADCDTAKTCSVCQTTEGEPLGHDWIAADCDSAKTCSVCQTTEGEPLEHTWVPNVVEATCQAGGYTLNTCAGCGATEKTNETAKDPDKHTYEAEWSGDMDNHWYAASCGCEDAPEKDLAAHTPDEDGVCTECGFEGYLHPDECSHPNKQVVVTVDATCVCDGVEIFNCADCGLVGYSQVLPMSGHEYDEGEIIDPTCTEAGYTLKICTREGCLDTDVDHTLKSDWIMPLGHVFDSEGNCEGCELAATVRITFEYIDAEGVTVTNLNEQFLVADNENPNYFLVNASRPNTQDFRYRFAGWYLDEACTEAITSIDTRISQELTVYGKWNAESISDHVHTFESEWDFDEYEHWKNSTCEHLDIVIESDGHEYDADSYCTVCGRRDPNWEKTYNVTWSETQILIQINEDSYWGELPMSSKRYLAGETGDNATVDTMVRNRNAAATEATKVKARYTYLEDGTGYGWGMSVDSVFSSIASQAADAPDVYVNYVYDMLAASFKGCLANLITGDEEKMGVNHFQFKDPAFKDTGTGYMLEYMKSMTLSKHHMHLLSSDYFIDTVRAFQVVPVNLKMLNAIPVDEGSLASDYVPSMANKHNSDRDGDGDFDTDDFYKLIWQRQWNYETLAAFAASVYSIGAYVPGGDPLGTLNDDLCFAIPGSVDAVASGMLYSTTIEIIGRDWSDKTNNYTFYYPTSNPELLTFCDNLASLFTNNCGIVTVGDSETLGYGTDALHAIRHRFTEGHILFGGIVCLGSLEYDEYTDMEGGFGIAPVPLYRVGDENGRPDEYKTQIHVLGRVGAINRYTTKFSQCSAYLDYQSTHSTDILNQYYEDALVSDISDGYEGNVEMLKYIRRNVRSSFDKVFEMVIRAKFSSGSGTGMGGEALVPMDLRWHALIKEAGYKLSSDDMKIYYDELIATKSAHLETIKNYYKNLPL